MVVVEKANKLIGKTVEIEFIRSLQTAAGKMMFAKLVERAPQRQDKVPIAPQQVAYHSDKNDQRLQARGPKTPRQFTPKGRKSDSRPRTSSQNEANLMNLVNQQDK
jgi:hypothetical protein